MLILGKLIMTTGRNTTLDQIIAAHKHSSYHRKELSASKRCGCFYCLKIFSYNDIYDWTDNNDTALCPECGIDSVIGDASGHSIEPFFLQAMHTYFF